MPADGSDSPAQPPHAAPRVPPHLSGTAAIRRSLGANFRRFFGRGLAVLLPSILTLWILWYAFAFVFNSVAVPINRGIRWGVLEVAPHVLPVDPVRQPEWYRVEPQEREEFIRALSTKTAKDRTPEQIDAGVRAQNLAEYWSQRWYLSILGLVVAIVLIYLAGLLLGGIIGRRLYLVFESLLKRIPGFKQIYPHVKQLVDLVMGDRPMAFKRVVLVQYPRAGIWSLGFVTSSSMRDITTVAGRAVVSIFIPSTPTPFTGFVINVPAADVVDLPITIDEAVRYLITGGVLIPEHQVPATLPPGHDAAVPQGQAQNAPAPAGMVRVTLGNPSSPGGRPAAEASA